MDIDADRMGRGNELIRDLVGIYKRDSLPGSENYLEKTKCALEILENEAEEHRPYSLRGLPGGLVYLKKDIPTVIVPDLHARMNFFLSVLLHEITEGQTVSEQLAAGSVQVVCVGDGFHAEGRAIKRWMAAYEEFKGGYKHHKNIDEEMRESLGVMEMVMEVKSHFPSHFHFLKGNHENISNEHGEGNYPFMKFVNEGLMVSLYMQHFYDEDLISEYYKLEKSLLLMAVGRNFIISHSEPQTLFSSEQVIEYRDCPDVIYGLTWTDNDSADEGSVREMLRYYLGEEEWNTCYYFGGHRPVKNGYRLRAGGKYVQIHDPGRFVIAVIRKEGDIDLDRDIIEIEDKTERIT